MLSTTQPPPTRNSEYPLCRKMKFVTFNLTQLDDIWSKTSFGSQIPSHESYHTTTTLPHYQTTHHTTTPPHHHTTTPPHHHTTTPPPPQVLPSFGSQIPTHESYLTLPTYHNTTTTIISFFIWVTTFNSPTSPGFSCFLTYLAFCPYGLRAEGLFNFFVLHWVPNPPAERPSGLNAEALFVLFFIDRPKNVKSFPLYGVRGGLCRAPLRSARPWRGDPLGKRLNIFWPASRFAAGWPRLVRGDRPFKKFLVFRPQLVRGTAV